MTCWGCGYKPWPCASCNVPRCMCRAKGDEMYRHYYPEIRVGHAPQAAQTFPCGHPVIPRNIAKEHGISKCRTCWQDYKREYMRDYERRRRRVLYLNNPRVTPISGEQLGRDYMEAR